MKEKRKSGNSQCRRLLAHFRAGGSVTSYEAYKRFKITQLAARITDLEMRGAVIARAWETNNGKRYVRYSLIHSKETAA